MIPAKIFYFFYYGAGAALFPFLVLFYRDLGLSGREIGLLTALPPLVSLFSASLWGGLADVTQRHRQLLVVALTGAIGFALLLSGVTTFLYLLPTIAAFAFFMAPVIPLVDHSVLESLGDQRSRYGRIRLWGALGWGIVAYFAGQIVEQFGLSWSFYGYAILMVACLGIAMYLPITQASIGRAFRQGLSQLLGNRPWRLFLLTLLIAGMGGSTAHSYLFLYMQDMGASRSLMGLSLTIATLSELVVFFYSGRLLDRWGTRTVLLFSLLAHVTRLTAYAFVRTPELVLLVQLLHGPTFSLIWTAGVSYANRMAPKGMGATAQGMLSATFFGLGATGGGLAGGFLYQQVGPFWMYFCAGMWVFLGFILFAALGNPESKGNGDEGR